MELARVCYTAETHRLLFVCTNCPQISFCRFLAWVSIATPCHLRSSQSPWRRCHRETQPRHPSQSDSAIYFYSLILFSPPENINTCIKTRKLRKYLKRSSQLLASRPTLGSPMVRLSPVNRTVPRKRRFFPRLEVYSKQVAVKHGSA